MAGAMGSPNTATCDSEGVKTDVQRLGPLACCAMQDGAAALNTAIVLLLVPHTSSWPALGVAVAAALVLLAAAAAAAPVW
jgi:hypothetical protein